MFKEGRRIIKELTKYRDKIASKELYAEDLLTNNDLLILIDYMNATHNYIKKLKGENGNENRNMVHDRKEQ